MLQGGESFLENHSYPPILFEAWDLEWFKDDKEKLLKFFDHLGYKISLNIKSEFVAQHPKNSVSVEFNQSENGLVNMMKIK